MREEEEVMAHTIRSKNEKVAKVKEDFNCDICHAKERLDADLKVVKETYDAEIKVKTKNIQELQESGKGDTRQLQCDINLLREHHTIRLQDLNNDYTVLIKKEQGKDAKLQGEMRELERKHLNTVLEIEEQAEIELLAEQQTYESASHQEVLASRRLAEEIDITRKKRAALVKDSDEHKESISTLQEKHLELNSVIANLTLQQRSMEEGTHGQDTCVTQLLREINSLSEEINAMERFVMPRKE